MASMRTTVSLQPDVYAEAREQYHTLGFVRLGDLINAAVREYMHRRRVQDQVRRLADMRHDRAYVDAVRGISRDFEQGDTEEFGTGY